MAHALFPNASETAWRAVTSSTSTVSITKELPHSENLDIFTQVVVPAIYIVLAFVGVLGNGFVLTVLLLLLKVSSV